MEGLSELLLGRIRRHHVLSHLHLSDCKVVQGRDHLDRGLTRVDLAIGKRTFPHKVDIELILLFSERQILIKVSKDLVILDADLFEHL